MMRHLLPIPLLLSLAGCSFSDEAQIRWAQVAELGIAAASGNALVFAVVFADRGLDAANVGPARRRYDLAMARARAGEVAPGLPADLAPKGD